MSGNCEFCNQRNPVKSHECSTDDLKVNVKRMQSFGERAAEKLLDRDIKLIDFHRIGHGLYKELNRHTEAGIIGSPALKNLLKEAKEAFDATEK